MINIVKVRADDRAGQGRGAKKGSRSAFDL